MPPRKAVDNPPEPREPRRSSRIADKPIRSPVEENPAFKPRPKKGGRRKRAAEGGEHIDNPVAKKAKGSSEENGEEHDQLGDDDDDDDVGASINIGDSIPAVTLKNEKDQDVYLAELTVDKGLILFVVPKADTPGCTRQACGFRDSYAEFTKNDFNVYCVSADTTSAQAKWQTKEELPFPLLSDQQRVLIKALGAADNGSRTVRSHFIFGKGGKLVNKRVPVKPDESPQQALEFITSVQV